MKLCAFSADLTAAMVARILSFELRLYVSSHGCFQELPKLSHCFCRDRALGGKTALPYRNFNVPNTLLQGRAAQVCSFV